MQLRYEGNPGILIVDGKNYTLKEIHWHSPSEHQIDGIQYALSPSLPVHKLLSNGPFCLKCPAPSRHYLKLSVLNLFQKSNLH